MKNAHVRRVATRYRTPLSCALLALLASAACADDPNPYSSEPYSLSQLTLDVTATAAQYPGSGVDVRVRLLADYNGRPVDLRLGEEDLLLASLDGSDKELHYNAPDYLGYLSNQGGDLTVVLVRSGGRTAVPVPLAKPFTVTASPSTFAVGDKVTIDLSPRPTLSKDTTVEITPEGCVGSKERIFATELPYVWDTSTLTRPGGDLDAGPLPEPCPVRLTTVVETVGAKPSATGISPFASGTKARASRAVLSEIALRF